MVTVSVSELETHADNVCKKSKTLGDLITALEDMIDEYEGYFEGTQEPECLIRARAVISSARQE